MKLQEKKASAILTGRKAMVRFKPFRYDKPENKTPETKERYKMIELTDPAKAQIDDYFQGKEPTPVRIFLNSGG